MPAPDTAESRKLQALASAEGPGPASSLRDARIVRLVPGHSERTEIHVDLKKIQNGKAEDVAMRPNDILVVPQRGTCRPLGVGER